MKDTIRKFFLLFILLTVKKCQKNLHKIECEAFSKIKLECNRKVSQKLILKTS